MTSLYTKFQNVTNFIGVGLVALLSGCSPQPEIRPGEILADLNGDGHKDRIGCESYLSPTQSRTWSIYTALQRKDGSYDSERTALSLDDAHSNLRPKITSLEDTTRDNIPDLFYHVDDPCCGQRVFYLAPGNGDGTFGNPEKIKEEKLKLPK